MAETEKSRFDRKMLLVGLVIALLFIGGSVYAWQNSLLKDSIGGAVQVAYIPEQLVEKDVVPIETEYAGFGVRREEIEIIRTKKPVQQVQSKQFIQIETPNGGETFCLDDTFNIVWSSTGVETVHVLLESDHKVYDFGTVSADGSFLREKIIVPQKDNSYRFVVISAEQEEVRDISDGFFAIQDCTE